MKVCINTIEKVKGFAAIAAKCKADITLKHDKYIVDGKSIMGIFSLDLSKDIDLIIESDDPAIKDECIALLKDYIV